MHAPKNTLTLYYTLKVLHQKAGPWLHRWTLHGVWDCSYFLFEEHRVAYIREFSCTGYNSSYNSSLQFKSLSLLIIVSCGQTVTWSDISELWLHDQLYWDSCFPFEVKFIKLNYGVCFGRISLTTITSSAYSSEEFPHPHKVGMLIRYVVMSVRLFMGTLGMNSLIITNHHHYVLYMKVRWSRFHCVTWMLL